MKKYSRILEHLGLWIDRALFPYHPRPDPRNNRHRRRPRQNRRPHLGSRIFPDRPSLFLDLAGLSDY